MSYRAAVITATSADPNRLDYMLELYEQVRSERIALQWYLCVDGPRVGNLPEVILADPDVNILNTDRSYGAAVARNFALQVVKEDYVTSVDDDDLLVPGGIESRVEAMASDPKLGWSAGTMRWLRNSGEQERLSQLAGTGRKEPGEVWRSWQDPQGPHALYPNTLMVRAGLL